MQATGEAELPFSCNKTESQRQAALERDQAATAVVMNLMVLIRMCLLYFFDRLQTVTRELFESVCAGVWFVVTTKPLRGKVTSLRGG